MIVTIPVMGDIGDELIGETFGPARLGIDLVDRVDQQQLLHIRELMESWGAERLIGGRQCPTRLLAASDDQLFLLKLIGEVLHGIDHSATFGVSRVRSGDLIGRVAGQQRVPDLFPGPLQAVVAAGWGVNYQSLAVHGLVNDVGAV